MDYDAASEKMKLQLSELEDLRLDMYENSKLNKECTNMWHDKRKMKIDFRLCDLFQLFNSRFKIFPGKLWAWWLGPFEVKRVTLNEVVEVWSESTGSFTAND